MIDNTSFTRDWLQTVNENLGWHRQEAQLAILEKAVAALHLLECLSAEGMDFIFKGGTSLMLILQNITRLSVDIDIVVESLDMSYEELFSRICCNSVLFHRFERDNRSGDYGLGTAHYKFFYTQFASESPNESYILLDLYRLANPYANTRILELNSNILCTSGDNRTVRVPDIDSILGDKLTAFAPDTIGIPLSAEPGHRPKRVEVLKQLYDIGNLFDRAENVNNILNTYNTIAAHEIKQLGLEITPVEVLNDTRRHAYVIGNNGKSERELYEAIAKGYKDFNKFVPDLSFNESNAVLAAAKATYLAGVLLSTRMQLEKYKNEIDMGAWVIAKRTAYDFNEYKYSNPEAFFYWYKASLIESQ